MTSSAQLRPLGELLGTEALGIDLARPLDEATFAWIGRVFAQHPVLVFRDQNLGAAELAAFGRRFGSPRMHALVKYRHAEVVSQFHMVVQLHGVRRSTTRTNRCHT
jgi:taurine dioxygenase